MPNNGIFILLAGPNGAGKSTVMQPIIDKYVKHYANPDKDPFNPRRSDLCQKVIEKEHIWRRIYPDSFTERCASTNLRSWFKNSIIRAEGIGTESNLVSNNDSIVFKIAKSYGMQTELHFIGTSLSKALLQVRDREKRDEQSHIDPEEVKRKYHIGLESINEHIFNSNVDVIMIYDNSRGKGEEQLILHIENGKTIYLNSWQPEWFKNEVIRIPPMADLELHIEVEDGQEI